MAGWGEGWLAADPPGQSSSLSPPTWEHSDGAATTGGLRLRLRLRRRGRWHRGRTAWDASRSLFTNHVPRLLLNSILRAGWLMSVREHCSYPGGPAHRYRRHCCGAYGPSRLGEILLPGVLLYSATLDAYVLYSMQACARHKRYPTGSLCFTTQDEQ